MIGVDLFAGAGGMSLGAAMAGVDVKVAIEIRSDACETYAKNHSSTEVICADLRTLKSLGRPRGDGELIVFGGPPCQGFSTSNQRNRDRGNPKNWLFREFLRLVDDLRPEWVVFENVAGILQTEGKFFVRQIETHLGKAGYQTTKGLLDAADFGIPQHRTRFFLVAAKNRTPPIVASTATAAPVTVMDAIGDLPVLRNGHATPVLPYRCAPKSAYAAALRAGIERCDGHLVTRNADHIIDRYKHIPQGGNWTDIPESMMKTYADRTRCHTGIYRRLTCHAPSIVLGNFRKNMLIHPTQNRGLSVREAARLQSFPDRYTFSGSIGIQQQQVGNAVPPLLAKWVFSEILAVANS
jgi:DNA (cytosine-5)-methyltransferase 1